MITVVAMVGVLALVTVPSFMTFYQSNKIKAAMRNFTSDIRMMRQYAITQGVQARLTFTPGAAVSPTTRAYDFWIGSSASGTQTWTRITQPNKAQPPLAKGYTRYLEDVIYFPNSGQTFPNSSGVYNVDFFPDGRVQMPANATTGTIMIKTDMKVPKQQYQVNVSPSGRVSVQ